MSAVACCAGCTGSATIQFVSLNVTNIDPPPAKAWRYDAREAFWWVDSEGDLNISLRCRRRNVFPGELGKADLMLCLRPGQPPAGSGRNYKLHQRETRTAWKSALVDQHLTSYAGVMTVIVDDEDHIHGSFRIWMRSQPRLNLFALLPQRPGSFLCFGTFEAVKGESRGSAIQASCVGGEWPRRPRTKPTSSRPAVKQIQSE